MLALVAALGALLAPAASDTPLATTGSTVVYWDNTRGHDVALAVWEPGLLAPRRIPGVKPGPIGRWDLDAGRGPGGALLATYAHCMPGGCRPWAIDLRSGVRRDLGVGRGRAPTVWGDTVVFSRGGRLYRGRIGRPSSVHRLPMPKDQRIESVELRGDQLAYTTRDDDQEGRGQALWLARLGAAPTRRPIDSGAEGEECSRELGGVTLTASGLTWTRFAAGTTSCRVRRPRLVHRPGGETLLPTGTSVAVLVGGRTVRLASPAAHAGVEDRSPCLRYDHRSCEIRVD